MQQQIGEIPSDVFPLALGVMLTVTFSCIFFSFWLNRETFQERKEYAFYWNMLLNAFLVLNFMNLWDAVVIDILIFGIIQPDFMTIKGVEEYIREHDTAVFHFIGFFKGQPWMLGFAAISAGISMLLRKKNALN